MKLSSNKTSEVVTPKELKKFKSPGKDSEVLPIDFTKMEFFQFSKERKAEAIFIK